MKTQNEQNANPAKTCDWKIYIHKKMLRSQNCHRKFIKNVLPEKDKENM